MEKKDSYSEASGHFVTALHQPDSEPGGSSQSGGSLPQEGRGKLGLAHSLLNFPSPHQLGRSTGIRKSKSLRITTSSTGATTSLSPEAATEILRCLSEEVEETDFSLPPTKRPRLQPSKARVITYDGEPLKGFSLFLPSKLPAAFPNTVSVLEDFVIKITATYLRLWTLAPYMDCIEIRLPTLYDEKLCDSADFLKEFVTVVFQQLTNVESIRELYVPKVQLQVTTSLEDILAGLLGRAAVSHLYLPLVTSLEQDDILAYDFKPFALFLQDMNLDHITVVSTDEVIGDFCEELCKEILLLSQCSVEVTYRNEELDAPGPDYISSLGVDANNGEFVKPSELLRSMNVYNVQKPARRERKHVPKNPGKPVSFWTVFEMARLMGWG